MNEDGPSKRGDAQDDGQQKQRDSCRVGDAVSRCGGS